MEKIYSQDAAGSTEKKLGLMYDNLAACLKNMPYLKYMAYEGASFCRSYSYSCNNLWPEELNSEVQEGSFCTLNVFEQNTVLEKVDAAYHFKQIALVLFVEPLFSFLVDYWSFIPGGVYAAKHMPCLMWGRKNFEEKFKCFLQTMKSGLAEAGDAKPNLLAMSSEEDERLLQKAQNITRALDLMETAANIVKEGGGPGGATSYEAPEDPTYTGVGGPIKTSLGKASYKNSQEQGHVGPISSDHRWPWDTVQPGLWMEAVDLTEYEKMAVCNDGSPAMMFYKFISPMKWHFHIDGGFFCYSKKSCLGRARSSTTLVSTKGWEKEKHNSGMFDPHMGGFPNYTHATIGYCSSDAWFGQVDIADYEMVGGTEIAPGKNGTHHRGYTILQTVLKFFLLQGMGSTPGQELFVSGCSAGSIAATAQADSWASRLTTLAGSGLIRSEFYLPYIWTMLDGAPIVSPPSSGNYPGELTILEMAAKLVTNLYGPNRGTSPNEFINKECVAEYQDNPSLCVWTAAVLPHIKTNNIVLNMYWDNFVTGQIYFYFIPGDAVQYGEGLHAVHMTKDVFKTCTKTQNYWAQSCGDHCISANPGFWRLMPITAPGTGALISARDMTIQTRDGYTGYVVADECEHYNCGCIGQNIAMNKMSQVFLYLEVLTRLTGNDMKLISPIATAIAADQTENPGQLLQP